MEKGHCFWLAETDSQSTLLTCQKDTLRALVLSHCLILWHFSVIYLPVSFVPGITCQACSFSVCLQLFLICKGNVVMLISVCTCSMIHIISFSLGLELRFCLEVYLLIFYFICLLYNTGDITHTHTHTCTSFHL